MIGYSKVGKRFGDVLVPNGLAVTVPSAEKLAIIGASGSWKRAILRRETEENAEELPRMVGLDADISH